MSNKRLQRRSTPNVPSSTPETVALKNSSQIMSRRNAIRFSLATVAGIIAAPPLIRGCHTDTDNNDAVVFDEIRGKGSKDIECYRQIHSGPEMIVFGEKDPTIFRDFIQFHRNLLHVLLDEQRQDASTIFCLEGCNESAQENLLSAPKTVAFVESISQVNESAPEALIQIVQTSARTQPAKDTISILQSCEASLQFLVRNKNNREKIYGTEPKEDEFEMFGSFITKCIGELLELDAHKMLTETVLQQAANEWNKRSHQELVDRHTYIQELLQRTLQPHSKAKIVIGAGHFRSGKRTRKEIDENLEDYLLRIPDTRVRVRDMSGLGKVIRMNQRGKVVETFTPDTIRQILEQQKTLTR